MRIIYKSITDFWIQTKWFSFGRFWPDKTDRWWKPTVDPQVDGGWALNWFNLRFRWRKRR